MEPKLWNVKTRVVVCGVDGRRITDDGQGVEHFRNLAAAHSVFPDLDPDHDTTRFRAAAGDPSKGEMKFETYQAHEFYCY